jgi:hypothetical protein
MGVFHLWLLLAVTNISVFTAFKENRHGIPVNIKITQYFNVLSPEIINTK